MFLSQHPNGTYYLFYCDETGNRHKVSTKCKTKALATEFLRSFRCQEHQRQIKVRNKTLSEFCAEYLSYVKTIYSAGTFELHQLALRRLQKHVSDILLRQLTPKHFDELKAEMLTTMQPVTANMRLKKLKACLNVATRWKLLEANPLEFSCYRWLSKFRCSSQTRIFRSCYRLRARVGCESL